MECAVPKYCVSICIPCKTKQVIAPLSKQTQPHALYCSEGSNRAFIFNGLAGIVNAAHTSVAQSGSCRLAVVVSGSDRLHCCHERLHSCRVKTTKIG